jgi:hypothetical protein
MRFAHTLSMLLCTLAASAALAQAPAAIGSPPKVQRQDRAETVRTEQRIEKITHEDRGSRIDELRVGGDTKSITVSPKGGMPAYEVSTGNANRQPVSNEREAGAGARGWKIFGF